MTGSSDVPLREYLDEKFDDIKDRFDYFEELFVGNGHPGVLTRTRLTEKHLEATDIRLAALERTKKQDRISLTGITSVIAAIVAGIVAGVTGRGQ